MIDCETGVATSVGHLVLSSLNRVAVKGIPGVAVKFVVIRGKSGDESALLGNY